MRSVLFSAIILAVAGLAASSASAQPPDGHAAEPYACRTDPTPPPDPDVEIAACTALLKEGVTSTERVNVLIRRAEAYGVKGDVASARADYDSIGASVPNLFGHLGERGTELIGHHDYQRAIVDLAEAARLRPDYEIALVNLGAAYEVLGEDDKAIESFQKALKITAREPNTHLGLAIIYARKHDETRARAEMDEAIRLNPKYAAAYRARSSLRWSEKDAPGAIADLDLAIKYSDKPLVEDYAIQCARRGEARLDLDAALQDCNRAVDLAPNDAKALLTRATVHERRREPDLVIADAETALKLDLTADKKPAVFDLIGRAHVAKGDPAGAVAAFDQALMIDPHDYYALSARARSRANRGDADGAMSDAAAAEALKPHDATTFWTRCFVNGITRRDLEGGLAACDQALVLKPDSSDARVARATVEVRLGKLTAAIADLNDVLKSHPEVWQAQVDRADAYFQLRDFDRALADAEPMVSKHPERPGVGDLLARIYISKKDFASATAAADQVLKTHPTDVNALLLRADAKLRSGDLAAALADDAAAMEADPKSASPYNDRCWHRTAANRDLDAASADCERALSMQPGDRAILDTRGFLELRMGRLDAAIADFDEALKGPVKFPSSYYLRGVARRRKGDAAGADADIAAAKALQPDVAEEYASYGVTG